MDEIGRRRRRPHRGSRRLLVQADRHADRHVASVTSVTLPTTNATAVARAPGAMLVRCDAIDLGGHVQAASAELAYLDPPFAVGAVFGARTRSNGSRATGPAA